MPPQAGGMPKGSAGSPTGAPILTPQPAAGKSAAGKVKVQIAIHALQLAMIDVGAGSPEGRSILEAITKLVKKFGQEEDTSKALMPAEIQQIMAAKNPAGPRPPGAGPAGAAPPPMPAAA